MAKKRYISYQPNSLYMGKKKEVKSKGYEHVKPLQESKQDTINMALIAMRKKNLDTVQDNERLKDITRKLNNRVRRSDQSKVSDIVHYWMSKFSE